jgi:hypothetical protein
MSIYLTIFAPLGYDMAMVKKHYPELCFEDTYPDEGEDIYSLEDDSWDYDDYVEACGFIETAIPGTETVIDGCGEWAMGENRESERYRVGAYKAVGVDYQSPVRGG